MADVMTLERAHPLSGKVFAGTGVAITLVPTSYKVSLRCGADDVVELSKAIGVDLPVAPNSSATKGNRTALWLGPDEWFVFDAKAHPAADLSDVQAVHSAVDVSHRNTAVLVSGPLAADLINSGCPRDLSKDVFPVGCCARTVFGKTEILLFHVKPNVYRIEVWRSFSDYLFTYLEEAARAL